MSESVIHLRVPAGKKARWVLESRAAGMRLTDWIVERVEMQSKVFDVTLYWHTGGSVFLGTVAAMSADHAETLALTRYINESKKNLKEFEEGGGYRLDVEPLIPSEAERWMANNT